MKEWIIPVSWEMCALVKVKAKTLEEAIKYVDDEANDIPLPEDGGYVDGSWKVSMDSEEEIFNCYNEHNAEPCGGVKNG